MARICVIGRTWLTSAQCLEAQMQILSEHTCVFHSPVTNRPIPHKSWTSVLDLAVVVWVPVKQSTCVCLHFICRIKSLKLIHSRIWNVNFSIYPTHVFGTWEEAGETAWTLGEQTNSPNVPGLDLNPQPSCCKAATLTIFNQYLTIFQLLIFNPNINQYQYSVVGIIYYS